MGIFDFDMGAIIVSVKDVETKLDRKFDAIIKLLEEQNLLLMAVLKQIERK